MIVQDKRAGKTESLNRGILASNGDILLFTDANSMLQKDSVKKLVRHFRDKNVGLVTGRCVYYRSSDEGEEVISGFYNRYEQVLKKEESKVGTVVGADGAIYAMRKELYEPLKAVYINDLIHPIQVVLKGYKAILETEAICREEIDESHSEELNRQTRIMAQSFLIYFSQILKLLSKRKLLYAVELTSHKFMRWFSLPWMLIFFISTIVLCAKGTFYQMVLIPQIVFITLAMMGKYLNAGILRLPHYFCLVHLAALLGLYKLISGNIYITWEPRKN